MIWVGRIPCSSLTMMILEVVVKRIMGNLLKTMEMMDRLVTLINLTTLTIWLASVMQ